MILIILYLSLIKISTLKIVQPLRYSQGNTQSTFYEIISNNLKRLPFPQKINLVRLLKDTAHID